MISSGEEAKKVPVPDVLGRSESEAEQILQDAKLKVTHGEAQYSDDVAAGNVIFTDPQPGTEVDEGSSVQIVVSLGKEKVKVPFLTGKSQADAESALAAAGLVGSASEEYSDTAAGTVISQSPDSGKEVEKGTTVSYVVSLGPKTQLVAIPDVVGATESAAKKRLQEEGLTAVYVEEEFSNYPAGTISRVSPAVGSKVEKGSQVQYWISIGPQQSGGGSGDGGDGETEE